MALRADGFEALVPWDSRLRDLLGEVSSLAPISSTFSSVGTVRFLSGFLSSSSLTKLCILCYLELLLLGTGTEIFWDLFQQTYIVNTFALSTHILLNSVSDSMHVVISINGWLRTALREANRWFIAQESYTRQLILDFHVSKHCDWLTMMAA
jgi:hypothetical protein